MLMWGKKHVPDFPRRKPEENLGIIALEITRIRRELMRMRQIMEDDYNGRRNRNLSTGSTGEGQER